MTMALDQNVAALLRETALRDPQGMAIAEPQRRRGTAIALYRQVTFQELDEDSTRIADGVRSLGARRGQRIASAGPPGH